ncbi:rRNA methyltransferase [Pelomonas sp. Root1217]|uniref:RNA methyltransferase n=1 Tax=Pelomonas sp. Root1217 TaxID=1736430 RepID=UPI00070DE8EC|nr:RNA methyltransferase [Pelomonas sp. Root1217]KQV60519.1 rRNA methyltransferase [Pelomonas sp. Root1217]
MLIADLRQRLRALGANPDHESRVLRHWLHSLPLQGGKRPLQGFLPKAVMAVLPGLMTELDSLVTLRSEHAGSDGESARLLLGLADGQTVETVLLPRDGVCVSSQVGCAVGCRFCMTGVDGLIRQVGSAEIVAQVVLARRKNPKLRKVVFMGMGEPSHNLANVLDAITLLGREGGFAHKQLVFSTVGDERAFAALNEAEVKPALALSLHTTDAAKRAELLPRAPRLTPEELVEAADAYARSSGYPIQYQWTLLDGVNDGSEELDGIVRLLKGRYGLLNMIPFNSAEGLPFTRPSWERARAIAAELCSRGVLTKLRDSAGQDVEGGCGQLRAREAVGRPARVVRIHA